MPLPDQTKFIACTAAEQTYGHGHPKARLKISSFCRVSGAWQVPKCAEQHTSASFHTLQPHVRHKHARRRSPSRVLEGRASRESSPTAADGEAAVAALGTASTALSPPRGRWGQQQRQQKLSDARRGRGRGPCAGDGNSRLASGPRRTNSTAAAASPTSPPPRRSRSIEESLSLGIRAGLAEKSLQQEHLRHQRLDM